MKTKREFVTDAKPRLSHAKIEYGTHQPALAIFLVRMTGAFLISGGFAYLSIFEAVKQSVTTRQAAEHFGIRVGRSGRDFPFPAGDGTMRSGVLAIILTSARGGVLCFHAMWRKSNKRLKAPLTETISNPFDICSTNIGVICRLAL